ncbi:MAG TPA: hemolysin family protein, partial [Pyrinomonadaceae bacterium]|nr:hemolysin family protein [Pyrinomonadaceae bacterium]
IITFLHIVLGELAPKTLALERAEGVALAVSWPLQAFFTLFRWPVRLLDWSGTRVVRWFGLHPSTEHKSAYTEGELRRLIDISRQSGYLESEEQQLIQKVFDFSDAEVKEAMVPRPQVTALPVTAGLNDVRQMFLETGYSRLPVYGKSLDDIIGVLFRKDVDMGRVSEEAFEMRSLVRPPVFIPVSSSLGDALRRMQASRVHFGFVVDEHGGTDGILTLEDLLEEIVGDIDDEFDEEAREQIKKDGETYILDGMLAVRDANKHFGLGLTEDGSYTTIAGFLLAQAGRLLRPGDRVENEAGVFSVERVENRRITRVRFRPALNP